MESNCVHIKKLGEITVFHAMNKAIPQIIFFVIRNVKTSFKELNQLTPLVWNVQPNGIKVFKTTSRQREKIEVHGNCVKDTLLDFI